MVDSEEHTLTLRQLTDHAGEMCWCSGNVRGLAEKESGCRSETENSYGERGRLQWKLYFQLT